MGHTTSEAIRSYITAKGYVQSIYLQMANPDRYSILDDTTLILSVLMLSGFAVELYLKTFLYHCGHTTKELKSASMRHDLQKLLLSAEEKGFSNKGANTLIDLLHEQHKSFEFRYMGEASVYRLKGLDEIFAAFDSLDVAVDTAIGASASKNLAPTGGWNFPVSKALWRIPKA